MDESRRKLKPGLPGIGSHGIPMRDELHLELGLSVVPPVEDHG